MAPDLRPLALGLALGVASLMAPACVGSTGNERIPFVASVGGAQRQGAATSAFTNEFGWEVALTQAKVTLGPVYFNTIPALRSAPASPWRAHPRWPWRWQLSKAWAGESHLGDGVIVGQVLGQVSVDLLSPALVPFPAEGLITRDQVRTAEIFFYPPPGMPPETMRPPTAAVELAGSAQRQGERVAFRGRLVLDDSWLPSAEPGERDFTPIQRIREVRGIPSEFVPDEGGRVEIRVDASALLQNADFSQITKNATDPDDPSVRLLRQGGAQGPDQVMKSLYNALLSSSGTYTVRWINPSSSREK